MIDYKKYGIGEMETKFRAWDIKEKRMTTIFNPFVDILNGHEEGHCINNMDDNWFELGDEESYIVMRYTGLKDKNGKEIYEGDIVRCLHDYERIIEVVVVYSCENNRFELINEDVEDFTTMAQASCLSIIGIIFENPELLEK